MPPADDARCRFSPLASRLETDRLLLREFRPSDATIYAALINERGPGARGFPATVEQAAANIERLAGEAVVSGIGFGVICRHDESEMIGYCGLLVGRACIDEPEIAYELLRAEHGKGYATEAAAVLVAAAAATGRQRLFSTVGAWNTASFRVLEKLGFRRHHTVERAEGGDLVYLVRDLAR